MPQQDEVKAGDSVEVLDGHNRGLRGVVLKANNEDKSYRVEVDGGPTIWCSEVRQCEKQKMTKVEEQTRKTTTTVSPKAVDLAKKRQSTGRVLRTKTFGYDSDCESDVSEVWDTYAEMRPRGVKDHAMVMITEGQYEGKTGKVMRIDDESVRRQQVGAVVRYRVQLDDGGTTWTEKVTAIGDDKKPLPRKSVVKVGRKSEVDAKKSIVKAAVQTTTTPVELGAVGSTVKIVGGKHGGLIGVVTKVAGKHANKQWQVEVRKVVDGQEVVGPKTWAVNVVAA